MESFNLTITLGNAAMSEPEHVAAALVQTALKVAEGKTEAQIRDENGNTVGEYHFADGHLRGHDDETAGTDRHNVRVDVLEQIIGEAEQALSHPAYDSRVSDALVEIRKQAREEHDRRRRA